MTRAKISLLAKKFLPKNVEHALVAVDTETFLGSFIHVRVKNNDFVCLCFLYGV
jgi:hypothetical protein